jgi:hypothetical protein
LPPKTPGAENDGTHGTGKAVGVEMLKSLVDDGVLWALPLLVLVGSLPAAKKRLSWLSWPVLLLALGGGAWAVRTWLSQSNWVSPGTSATLKYGLRQLGRADEKNVLIIDGGSYAQRGIDPVLLSRLLNNGGYSVRVVTLAMSAANHFERYQLYRDLVARLAPKTDARQRWVLLAEVQMHYDTQPLAQVSHNPDSVRNLHYLTPANTYYALVAQQDPNLARPSEDAWRWDLLRQTSINALNVGVRDRLVALDDAKVAKVGLRRSGRFSGDFDMQGVMEEMDSPSPLHKPPRWTRRIREKRLLEVWGNRLDELVYFSVPSTRRQQLEYGKNFCDATRRPCIAPRDRKLLRSLRSPRYWKDVGHLNSAGAQRYTEWLAGRVLALQLLQK